MRRTLTSEYGAPGSFGEKPHSFKVLKPQAGAPDSLHVKAKQAYPARGIGSLEICSVGELLTEAARSFTTVLWHTDQGAIPRCVEGGHLRVEDQKHDGRCQAAQEGHSHTKDTPARVAS
jgi:hypothetical protein